MVCCGVVWVEAGVGVLGGVRAKQPLDEDPGYRSPTPRCEKLITRSPVSLMSP